MFYLPKIARFGFFGLLALTACVGPQGSNTGDRRAAVQDMRADTLSSLYTVAPSARDEIDRAEGYGVFSNVGVNLILASVGSGYGVVRDNETRNDVYMKMLSGGLGLGLGVKDFRGIFVFTTRSALANFINHGWDASAQADLAAKAGDKGGAFSGAIDVAPGIKLYQITESGLALQATIQGTKYWRDDDLTAPSVTITSSP